MRFIIFLLAGIILIYSTALNAKPVEADKLYANPDNTSLLLSPDGKYVTSYRRQEKEQTLELIDLKSNQIMSIAKMMLDITMHDYLWLNNTQIFISVEKDSINSSLIGNLKNRQMSMVLIKAQGYLVHPLPEDPQRVLFARKHGKNSDRHDLYIVEINDLINDDFSNAEKIKHNDKDTVVYFYDHDFKRVITLEFVKKDKTVKLKYIPVEGGKWKDFFEIKDVDYRLEPVGFINDEKFAVLTNKDTDKVVLREFDVKSQEIGKIIYQHPNYDLSSAGFLPDGKLDFVKYSQHGLTKTLYFDKGTDRFLKRLTKTFTNQEVYFVDKAVYDQVILLYVNGSDQPGEYYLYESMKDRAKLLLVSYPELKDIKFSPSELIKVKASDGTELEAFLTMPKEIDHSTLLVMPHGGPIDVQESDRFNKDVQYFASRGFAVLRVNFRGSSGFGKAFLEKGVGEFGRLIEEDISAAVNRVIESHSFKYVCAMGSSYGGYSAAMLAIKNPDLYDCVIGSFGVYDLPLIFNTSNLRSTEEYRETIARTVGEYSEDMVDYSPVYMSDKLKAPILLIAGKLDDTADFEHSNRFKYMLKKRNHPVETMFYKNEGHGHSTWGGDMHEAALCYDFLMRSLNLMLPDKSDDPDYYKALGDDYAGIADGYEFGYEDEEDHDKSFDYYKKAAEFGHGRAAFNIGASYHSGDPVEKNMAKAVEYYRKAADQDYSGAHNRLARMYMEGEYLEQDWDKAYTHITKAQSLEDNPENNIMLARFYCTAPDKYKNIDECTRLLDIEQYKLVSKHTAQKATMESMSAISWIISEGKFSGDELIRIHETVKKTFAFTHSKTSIKVVDEGEFSLEEGERFGESDKYVFFAENFDIKAKDDEKGRFGIRFTPDVPGVDGISDRVVIALRWVQTGTDGNKKVFNSRILFGPPIIKWPYFAEYKDIKEEGTWELEMYDLEQNKIFSRKFHVTPMDKEKTEDISVSQKS